MTSSCCHHRRLSRTIVSMKWPCSDVLFVHCSGNRVVALKRYSINGDRRSQNGARQVSEDVEWDVNPSTSTHKETVKTPNATNKRALLSVSSEAAVHSHSQEIVTTFVAVMAASRLRCLPGDASRSFRS